jgi:predicted transglutaminase-like cysteine proteinase
MGESMPKTTRTGIMHKRIAKKVLKDVFSCFVYEKDKVEDWTCHADSVEAGEVFKDDCDGFALTCAELLLRRGVPKSEVSLVVCNTSGGGHLVCGLAANGTTWILDNNQHFIYDWVDSRYEWKYFMNLDYRGIWRNVSNA